MFARYRVQTSLVLNDAVGQGNNHKGHEGSRRKPKRGTLRFGELDDKGVLSLEFLLFLSEP